MAGARVQKHQYFYTLDIVRFFAAFIVAIYHLGWSTWLLPTSLGAPLVHGIYTLPAMEPVAWWGAVGVPIFFVISGFVIANSANNQTPLHFLKSRIERLYPCVWIIAPITAVAWLASGVMPIGDITDRLVRSLSLLPAGPWIDGTYWTLPCEMFFYGLIFLLLLSGRFANLERFSIGLALISGCFNILYFADFAGISHLAWVHIFAEGPLKPALLYYGVLFALGTFIWLDRQGMSSVLGRKVAIGTLVICAIQVALSGAHDRPNLWEVPFIAWGVSVFAIRYINIKPGIHASRLIRLMGLATYPLYLIHFTIGCFAMRTLVTHGVPPYVALALTVVGLVCAACLITLVFEPRLRRVLRVGLLRLETPLRTTAASKILLRPGGLVTNIISP